jgi:hypothetical protein
VQSCQLSSALAAAAAAHAWCSSVPKLYAQRTHTCVKGTTCYQCRKVTTCWQSHLVFGCPSSVFWCAHGTSSVSDTKKCNQISHKTTNYSSSNLTCNKDVPAMCSGVPKEAQVCLAQALPAALPTQVLPANHCLSTPTIPCILSGLAAPRPWPSVDSLLGVSEWYRPLLIQRRQPRHPCTLVEWRLQWIVHSSTCVVSVSDVCM